MFSRLFGKGREPAAQLPIVRNVTLGRSLKVDPLAWRRFGAEARFSLDRDTLEMTGERQFEFKRSRRGEVLPSGRAGSGSPFALRLYQVDAPR